MSIFKAKLHLPLHNLCSRTLHCLIAKPANTRGSRRAVGPKSRAGPEYPKKVRAHPQQHATHLEGNKTISPSSIGQCLFYRQQEYMWSPSQSSPIGHEHAHDKTTPHSQCHTARLIKRKTPEWFMHFVQQLLITKLHNTRLSGQVCYSTN
jgi:hypothetical protein